MRCCLILLIALHCLTATSVSAQEAKYPRRVYTTANAGSTPPRIDGILDDACWDRVDWGGNFVQWEPTEGDSASQQTAFKILYDQEALYIAYRAYDTEPGRIVDRLARRDRFPGDWVEINIDSYHDRRTGFSFTASVSGTRGDEFISRDGNSWDGSWDPIWKLETQIDADGWTAELMIPLSQLRYASKTEHVWGIQVQRRLFRKEERSLWQMKDKNEPGWVSRFGELHGIRDIPTQRQVELLPYFVAKGERFESVPGDPFLDGQNGDVSGGLDGKIGVTSNLTLDFTLNPDFGQVEADPSDVNLSAFETFFPERRPFFIEGRNILNFQVAPSIAGGSFTRDNLFYSRRIGRSPRHFPDLADGEYVDMPQFTSILGAFKLTGKTSRGLSVGLLESVASKERAVIDFTSGTRKETVEPATNYMVARLQQDIDEGNTQIGAMITATNRKIGAAHLNFMHSAAYAAGFDFTHQWNDKTWYTAGTASASRVEGSQEALLSTQTTSARYFQRPDNQAASVDSMRTDLTGYGGSLRFGRGGGGNLRFETGVAARSPGFEINDVGFMGRADEVNQFGWVGYSIRNSFFIFRRIGINANQWANWDFGGVHLYHQVNSNFNAQFKNNWHVGGGSTKRFEQISNTYLRGGPSMLLPGELTRNFWVNSDRRKSVTVDFGAYAGDGNDDSYDYREVWGGVGFRPTNALHVTLSPTYSTNDQVLQYVSESDLNGDPRYLFGTLEQQTAFLTARVDWTLTPNLTVQFYGQPFVSSGSYTRFKRITDPHAEGYEDRYREFQEGEIQLDDGVYEVDETGDGVPDYSFDDPDFNVRDFNMNLVVRWEYSPGSQLYLVWSQARFDYVANGRFSLGNDVDSLFDIHPHNVFLIKLSKWFSM